MSSQDQRDHANAQAFDPRKDRPWIIVKRTGREVEIVHWGDLPDGKPIKLRAVDYR